jgi:5'-3' exonuclease
MASTIDASCATFETTLIELVCNRIDSYLTLVQPKRVIIAFDGVPPMAKIKQQRERRYKSWVMPTDKKWNTIQITPGTAFMNQLDVSLREHFKSYPSRYEYFKLSTSVEEGEGEHKIFSFIRENPDFHRLQNTLVYGLDSDLIILSLNHLTYGNIKLLREAPSFMLKDHELHLLDVKKLADGICELIGNKLADYIFMTLLLGNDFMPHFPALNLRTNGFDTLLKTYRESVLPNECLFDGNIHWDVFTKFINALSKQEEVIMIQEYLHRNKMRIDVSTEEKKKNSLPMLRREIEHYICPIKKGWESRYYSSLVNDDISSICKNYVDMIQWNINYYTIGCTDWEMKYNYMYPPLLVDLAKHVQPGEVTYNNTKMSPTSLLRYVLPPPFHHYIPTQESKSATMPKLVWAYCRYTWESHVMIE